MTTETDIRRTYPAGVTIFEEGAPGDCAYVIEQGEVEISIRRDDRDVVLAHRHAGEIIGEMAIVDAALRSASVKTVTECNVLVLTRDQLQSRLSRMDPVLRMVFGVILDRFRDSLKGIRGDSQVAAPSAPIAGPGETFRSAIDRIELEQELRRGVAAGEIEFHHQPLICAASRRTIGYEALARWRHPENGLVGPGRFIPVAEETGLIHEISRLAVASAAAAAARLRREAADQRDMYISANVTPEDLCDPAFFDYVCDCLGAADLAPDGLVLEITESTLIENADQASAMLHRYRELGVGVSIDDFGAGYSNFNYLALYPFRSVKIDKSVVDQIADGEEEAASGDPDRGEKLIRAIVMMAHGLDFKVVAEGVETAQQADALGRYGCETLQGYFFGKPQLIFDHGPARTGMNWRADRSEALLLEPSGA